MGFFDKAKMQIKEKIKDQREFRSKVRAEKTKAFRKQAIREARKEGIQKAKRKKPLGGLRLGSQLQQAKAEPKNVPMTKTTENYDSGFGSGLRASLMGGGRSNYQEKDNFGSV